MLNIVLSSRNKFFDNVKICDPLGCSDHNQIYVIIKKVNRIKKCGTGKSFHKGRYDMRKYLAKMDGITH